MIRIREDANDRGRVFARARARASIVFVGMYNARVKQQIGVVRAYILHGTVRVSSGYR